MYAVLRFSAARIMVRAAHVCLSLANSNNSAEKNGPGRVSQGVGHMAAEELEEGIREANGSSNPDRENQVCFFILHSSMKPNPIFGLPVRPRTAMKNKIML